MLTIDLRKDTVDVRRMLADAVQKYAKKHKNAASAKKHPPITRIDIAFSMGDSESTPWVHLNYDTKPGCEPDGDPTHPDFAKLARSDWLPAVQAVCNGEKVGIIGTDGKTRKCGDAQLTTAIGRFLVTVLLECRDQEGFAELPKAKRCELGVEDPMSGEFGWPNYEDRGKENLVH